IIGVMPGDFRFLNRAPALILPLRFNRDSVFIGNFSYQAIARLKAGVSLDRANADVARMLPLLARKFRPPPEMNLRMLEEARFGPDVRPLKQDVIGDVGKVLWVLMGTVGIVLLIACANVANLLLVNAEGRQQELAVRAALGASRLRIARELFAETMTLGLAGGAAGIAVAYAAVRLLVFLAPANFPRLDEISIDPSALAYALAISLLAGVLLGLAPVFKYAGPRLHEALRAGGRAFSEGRERRRTRSALVVVQIALALVLLIGAGLMIRTLQALKQVSPGFTLPGEVLTLRVSIPAAEIPEPERVARMYSDILHRIAAIPGVKSAGVSNSITMDGTDNNDVVFVEDRPGSDSQLPPIRRFKHISPGFLHTMGNPIVAGRDLTWTDVFEMRPVVLVSENFAREYWSSPAAAIGRRIRENPKGPWREIVGVAGNERDNGADQKAPAIVYWPMMKGNFWGDAVNIQRALAFAIRSSRTGSSSFQKEVQAAVWSVNANLPVASVRTVAEIYGRSMARTSF
ncbi:MAG: FtsX-like permease family protein, partial [Bryobacteraceae bacterium]